MIHSETTFCQKEQHSRHPLRYLCLEEQCKGHRLLCQLCVRDCHSKHSLTNFDRYVEPLAKLGMNYQHPSRSLFLDTFEATISSILTSWQHVTSMMSTQSTKLQQGLIDHLETVSHTFSQTVVEEVSAKLSNGEASEDEIEGYAKMINLLRQKDFSDSDKLMEALLVIQKNITQAITDLKKKIQALLKQFQAKISKFSFATNSLESIIQSGKNKSKSPYIFPELQGSQQKPKGPKGQSSIKQQHTCVFQSLNKESSSFEIAAKTEEDTIESIREMKIGVDGQWLSQLKGEARNRIRRVIVGYCRSPQTQLLKILSLPNLQELEINWYQLAKKDYLIKFMNNLPNLKSLVLNCANEFDEECSRIVSKKLPKLRKLQYGWDFLNALRDYDQGIYFRLSPYTNRGCPLKTSVTRQMAVGLKKLQNVWLGDFMYFRPSNNEIPFRNIKQFTLGQTNSKYFRIPQKLCGQLKDMRQLLSLAILHVRIDERKLHPILINNPFIKTFVIEGCDDITDESLKILAKHCNLMHLSIRDSKFIEGTPIWEMGSLSTLILAECSRIKAEQAISCLPKMNYLTYINLYDNRWVNNEVVKSIPNRQNIQSLNLGRTAITDEALTEIGSMRQLKSLCLDCNKLNGLALVNLAKCLPEIQKISLWGLNGETDSGNINDYDLEALTKQLIGLHHLSIRYCKRLSSHIFLKFANLRFLQIERENLSKDVEEELTNKGVKVICQLQKEVKEV